MLKQSLAYKQKIYAGAIIAAEVRRGLTIKEISKQKGIGVRSAKKLLLFFIDECGATDILEIYQRTKYQKNSAPEQKLAARESSLERGARITEQYENGLTLQAIADLEGNTRENIRKIIKRFCEETGRPKARRSKEKFSATCLICGSKAQSRPSRALVYCSKECGKIARKSWRFDGMKFARNVELLRLRAGGLTWEQAGAKIGIKVGHTKDKRGAATLKAAKQFCEAYSIDLSWASGYGAPDRQPPTGFFLDLEKAKTYWTQKKSTLERAKKQTKW